MERSAEKAVELLTSEFAAIRAHVERQATTNIAILSLNLTTIAAIAGLVISQRTTVSLVLVLPIICPALGLTAFGQSHGIVMDEDYVIHVLQPMAIRYGGDSKLFGWAAYRQDRKWPSTLAITIAHGLASVGTAILALMIVVPHMNSAAEWTLWILGALLTTVLVSVWAVVQLPRQMRESRQSWQSYRARSAQQLGDQSGESGSPSR